MARYSDEERAQYVLMLEAAGYPDTKGALTKVSKHTGVPLSTLSRWFRKQQNPPPSKLVNEKRFDLIEAIRRELRLVVHGLDETRDDADYRALMTAFGILFDKHQLLQGNATERNDTRILIEYADAKADAAPTARRSADDQAQRLSV